MDFKLQTGPLSDETKVIAKEELRETPENIEKGFKELREYLKNDTTIHYRDDDEFLTIFLRPSKWYAKSAYELVCIKKSYASRKKKLLNCFAFLSKLNANF